MTELVIGWFEAIWGREALRQRVERLEVKWAKARILLKSYAETTRTQAETITVLEAENRKWADYAAALAEEEKHIDPDAKCPGCGHCKGHLDHSYDQKTKELRVCNNCEVCGIRFISAVPVAGSDVASSAYQPKLGV